MNELITVTYDNDRPTVLGRDLHEKLGIKTAYKDWFPRMCEYGFIEGEDFCSFLSESSGGRPAANHQLTLDMAKQICMIQRSELGRQYREYFLEIERRWNDPVTSMARSLVYANRQLASVTGQLEERSAQLRAANATIEELAPKAAYCDALAGGEGDTSFRETAKRFNVPEKRFIAVLIAKGYIYRDTHGTLMPFADHQRRGQFVVREVIDDTGGRRRVRSQTKITPTGRQVIWRMLAKEGMVGL